MPLQVRVEERDCDPAPDIATQAEATSVCSGWASSCGTGTTAAKRREAPPPLPQPDQVPPAPEP